MKLNFKFIIAAAVLIFQGLTFAQTNSGYSRIGIGDLLYSYSAPELGMGQLTTSVASSEYVGITNPATWYKLNMTRFQVNLAYSGLYLSDNTSNSFSGKAQFGGFTLAFPISKEYGAAVALGLVPYSGLNYNITQTDITPSGSIGDYNLLYQGQGGISRAFVGSSYKLPYNFIFGAAFDYYFGNISHSASAVFFNSNDVMSKYTTLYQASGLGGDFGLISPDLSGIFSSKAVTNFRAAVAINYLAPLNADTLYTTYSSLGTDTVGMGTIKMKIPLRISAGLSIMFSNKYLLSLDMASQAWSNYKLNDINSGNLRNSLLISAGFEYRPKPELGASEWKQIIWRAGLNYQQTQYYVNGTGINQYSIAAGFSYPLSYENTVDFAVEYGIRGQTDLNLIKENFIKINVGLSLGELWFLRPTENNY